MMRGRTTLLMAVRLAAVMCSTPALAQTFYTCPDPKPTTATESHHEAAPGGTLTTITIKETTPLPFGSLDSVDTQTVTVLQPNNGGPPITTIKNTHSQEKPTPPSLISYAAACGFFLRNTILDDQQGASFQYGHDGASHSNGFKTTFAAGYRSRPFGDELYDIGLGVKQPLPYLIWDVDGNLGTGSQSTKKSSVMNVRPEFGWDLAWPAEDLSETTGVFFRFGPMFEAVQDFSVRNAFFELSTTLSRLAPTGLVLGQYRSFLDTAVDYRFRPYFSIQAGKNIHGATLSGELNDTRLRLSPQPILEFQLHDPKQIGLTSAVLQFTDTYVWEPLEGISRILAHKKIIHSTTSHNYFTASLQFGLTPSITFGPTYTTGAIPPLFKRDTTFTVALKIGFGGSGGQLIH